MAVNDDQTTSGMLGTIDCTKNNYRTKLAISAQSGHERPNLCRNEMPRLIGSKSLFIHVGLRIHVCISSQLLLYIVLNVQMFAFSV